MEQNSSQNYMVNLYDAFGKESEDVILDWGLSIYIRFNGANILFDGGSSAEVLENNSKAIGIDLSKIDYAVLSHNHFDHSTGLDYLLEVNPNVKLYLPDDENLGGGPEKNQQIKRGFRYQKGKIKFVGKKEQIENGILLIGTTSDLTGEFWRYPPHDKEPELQGLPELSLLLWGESRNKTALFTGCSHSGVENIAQRACKMLNNKPIDLIVGGYHLIPYKADYIQSVVQKLNDVGVKEVAPTHCTGDRALGILKKKFGDKLHYFGVGSKVNL